MILRFGGENSKMRVLVNGIGFSSCVVVLSVDFRDLLACCGVVCNLHLILRK